MPNILKILINTTSYETRVAVIEDGVVQELKIERPSIKSLVGNIYKAKVVRVIPGMQAAFVDIGLDKNGFIHIDDIRNNSSTVDQLAKQLIEDRLYDGESIWVQVSKDPFSDKGARLTTRLSVSTRYLVYLPLSENISVSNKITSKSEQARLVESVCQSQLNLSMSGGFIVRTSAKNIADNVIQDDMSFLQNIWKGVSKAGEANTTISLVHKEASLLIRTLRELKPELVESIWIDSQESFNLAKKYSVDCFPELQSKIYFYTKDKPIFAEDLVEQQIQASLKPIVKLDNGGHLIIEQTAAMATIDVNTGSYVGNKDHTETVLNVNLVAAKEVARQISLRNLCGIIVVDFIDMIETQHQKRVLKTLASCLATDKVTTSHSQFSSLGLIEISRQRTDENLEQLMCVKCNVCEGQGLVKSNETLCYEIFRDILRQHTQFKASSYTITTSSEIMKILEDEEKHGLIDLQKLINVPINLVLDQHYDRQYNIALN